MRIIVLALIVISGITIAYFMMQPEEKPLPVINPVDVEEEMVDPEMLRIGYGHKIGEFSFQNQLGRTITRKEVEGKVFVAEYFFTTCRTICPAMNKEMTRVYDTFKDNDKVRILSFTVDPETDTVARMKVYAERHGLTDDKMWHFLTGKKEELYALARKSFFVLKPTAVAKTGDGNSDFIHTNNFVLVDQKLRIRGYYDGTNPEEVDQMMHDMNRLLEEK